MSSLWTGKYGKARQFSPALPPSAEAGKEVSWSSHCLLLSPEKYSHLPLALPDRLQWPRQQAPICPMSRRWQRWMLVGCCEAVRLTMMRWKHALRTGEGRFVRNDMIAVSWWPYQVPPVLCSWRDCRLLSVEGELCWLRAVGGQVLAAGSELQSCHWVCPGQTRRQLSGWLPGKRSLRHDDLQHIMILDLNTLCALCHDNTQVGRSPQIYTAHKIWGQK